MVRQGTFREDLYHRLSVTAINIPPLRERKTDIRPLVQFFLNRYRHTAPKPLKGFTGRFLERLMSYEWPGNIRELENTVRSAIALARTAFLTTHELKELGTNTYYPEPRESRDALSSAVLSFMKDAAGKGEKNIYEKLHQEVDNTLLPHILTMTDENQSEAARILGISRLTLRKKLLR
jgi:DNA-binding NtrC family response regulator